MRRATGWMAALWAPAVASAIPVQLPHQGRAMDASGSPVNGAVTVDVALWDDATSTATGDRLWSASYPVTAQDGYYSLVLDQGVGGATIDSAWFADPLWLEVRLGGATSAPRQPIGVVPRAASAHQADTATTAGSATSVTGGAVTTSGVTVTGAGAVVLGQTTATSCSTPGAIIYDPTAQTVKVCVGTTWQGISSAVSGTIGTQTNPATTCKALHAANTNLPSALYWIKPDSGAAVQVWCDMTTAPGGWTRTNVFQTGNNSWCTNDAIWSLIRRIAAGRGNGGQLMFKSFYPGTAVTPDAGPFNVATMGTGPYNNLTSMFAWAGTSESWPYNGSASFGFNVIAGPGMSNQVWWDHGATLTNKANFCVGSTHMACVYTRAGECPGSVYVNGAWRSSAAVELYVLEP